MCLDTTVYSVLPLLIEELEEVILDPLLVRLTHEVIEDILKILFTSVRSSVVRVTRIPWKPVDATTN